MKKLVSFTIITIISLIAVSCKKDHDYNSSDKQGVIPKYQSLEVFNNKIGDLLSFNEQELDEYSKLQDYLSLQKLYNQVIEIYDTIETQREYLELKDEFGEYLYFSPDIENAMVQLPLKNEIIAYLIDVNGNAYIGDSLYNFINENSSLKNKTSFCAHNDGKRRVEAWLSTDENVYWSILYAKAYKHRLWKWRSYNTIFYVKNEGSMYMVDWDNEGNEIKHYVGMTRVSNERSNIRWDYRKPLFVDDQQQKINFKVWTRGVVEDKACYVTGLGWGKDDF